MTTSTRRISALGLVAIALGLALLWVQAAAASTVSPLPASDYSVRSVCGVPAPGHARCLALELVPRTAAARAHTHPLGMTRSAPIRSGKAAESAYGLRPQDLHSAYGLPTTASSAQTIAVIDAYDDPTAEGDLKVYDEEFGLPACTTANGCFTKLNGKGKASPLPETEGGWALEISLDIEVAHAVCQNCHILLVEAESSRYEDLEAAEDSAVTAGATEISNSWLGGEPATDSAAFNHHGTVITAAAGDDGYLNWDAPEEERGFVGYPASSPHVIAVGGTRLELNSSANTWKSETVWNGYGAGGGGCSEWFKVEAPPWQQELPNWSSVGCGSKRAVADVSADADPYTGVAVYDSTPYPYEKGEEVLGWLPLGGTSLASPLIASVFALAGGADGVEYPAKTLYENEIKAPASLHDIQSGSNGKCSKAFNSEGLSGCTALEEAASCKRKAICLAGPGYDGPTGVGTPDGIAAFEPTSTKPPTVVTDAASAVSQTSATLNATVNPNRATVSACSFEYGTSASYGSSVPCASLPGSGTSAVAVSASITGLAANTEYHFRIVATNPGGTSYGSDQTLKTLPNPPTIVTSTASAVTQTSATLNATVNPNGANVSSCSLEYGTTTSYGSSAPCASPPGSGTSAVAVSASITGLTANTTYYFRISATNPGGTSKGNGETFTTLPNPPAVATGAASAVSPTSAILNAEVNPNGGGTSECKLEYGPTASYGSIVPCTSLPIPGTGAVEVSTPVGGLSEGITYHFRIVATNAGGTSQGSDQTFTTQLPTTLLQQIPGEQGTPSGQGVLPSQEHRKPPVPDAELASTSLTANASGRVSVRVSCPVGESSCIGTITLRTLTAVGAGTTGHQSKKSKAAILTLAVGSFKVAGGRVVTVKLHLSARARTLLARAHVLRARATIFARDPAGATHTAQTTVTIRAAKAARGRKA